MTKNIIVLLLATCLLLQTSGLQQSAHSQKRASVILDMLQDYAEVIFLTLVRARVALNYVLDDLTKMNASTTNTNNRQSDINKIRNFVRGIEKLEARRYTYPELVTIYLPNYLEVAERYNSPVQGDLDYENQLIRAAFERNNIEVNQLKNNYVQRFKISSRKYNEPLRDFIDGLNEMELREETDIIDFYNQIKDEKDGVRKLNVFIAFINNEKNNNLQHIQ